MANTVTIEDMITEKNKEYTKETNHLALIKNTYSANLEDIFYALQKAHETGSEEDEASYQQLLDNFAKKERDKNKQTEICYNLLRELSRMQIQYLKNVIMQLQKNEKIQEDTSKLPTIPENKLKEDVSNGKIVMENREDNLA